MDLIKRTEVLSAENDLKAIRKALESISDKMATDSKDAYVVVSNGLDPFFGKLHISNKHLAALQEEYSYNVSKYEIGLMEECSELIQALSKRLRGGVSLDNIIEEMAHTIVCMRLVCLQLQIKPEDIQKEIMKKYPDGYSGKEDFYADNIKYTSVDHSCD